jgi:hypothetical protein
MPEREAVSLTNVNMKVDGETLTVVIDLSQRHGKSKKGRSVVVATTHGFAEIPGHGKMWLSLNCNVKEDK